MAAHMRRYLVPQNHALKNGSKVDFILYISYHNFKKIRIFTSKCCQVTACAALPPEEWRAGWGRLGSRVERTQAFRKLVLLSRTALHVTETERLGSSPRPSLRSCGRAGPVMEGLRSLYAHYSTRAPCLLSQFLHPLD